jgi:hypothetical protein
VRRRSTSLVILLSLLLAMSIVTPAWAASSAWDPNDTSNVLDLRWVGTYRQDPDTVRVSITFWNPVRDWMLKCWGQYCGSRRSLLLESLGLLHFQTAGSMYVTYMPSRGWGATLFDGGSSGVIGQYPAAHPNPHTFLVWLPAPHATHIYVQTCAHGNGCNNGHSIVDQIPALRTLSPDP